MSLNVQKCIDAMKQNEGLVLDLNLAVTAIIMKAGVQLTLAEKVELWNEVEKTIDKPDPYVHVHM